MYSVLRCFKSGYTKGNLIQENKSSKRGSIIAHIPYIVQPILSVSKTEVGSRK